MIIIPHYYSPNSFCRATPFLFPIFLLLCYLTVLIVSSLKPCKVFPHHSLPSHWALTHDPYLAHISMMTCYIWVH